MGEMRVCGGGTLTWAAQLPLAPQSVAEAPGASAAKRGCAAAFHVAALPLISSICAARSGWTVSLAGAAGE